MVQGSNCTSLCLSSLTAYSTNGSDVACHDSDYNTTVSGGTFQECVSCELQSQAVDSQPFQSNLGWAFCECNNDQSASYDLHLINLVADNMRYALDWCLFNYTSLNNQSAANSCSNFCAPISNALKTNLLTPNSSTTYDFCQNADFLNNVEPCASCYKIIPNQLYMSNCEFIHQTLLQYQTLITDSSPPYTRICMPKPITTDNTFLHQARRHLHPSSNLKLVKYPRSQTGSSWRSTKR